LTTNLYFEEYGEAGNPSLVFLHGLLGSSRNWRSVAKEMAGDYHIYCLDLPEHGESIHLPKTSLSIMQRRIEGWIEEQGLEKYRLCGHSLGGKLAMSLACRWPQRVVSLTVADIAPRDYPPEHHLPTFDALLDLDLLRIKNRKHADEVLSERIPNWAFRQFLLTNLVADGERLRWRANLEVLRAGIADLSRNPLASNDHYDGPALVVRGGKSGYVRSEHIALYSQYFCDCFMVTLPEAGHDVHVEDRTGFVNSLRHFLGSNA
jgi:esterase